MGCGPICEKCPQGSDVSCAFFLSVSQKYGNLSDVFRKNGEIFDFGVSGDIIEIDFIKSVKPKTIVYKTKNSFLARGYFDIISTERSPVELEDGLYT